MEELWTTTDAKFEVRLEMGYHGFFSGYLACFSLLDEISPALRGFFVAAIVQDLLYVSEISTALRGIEHHWYTVRSAFLNQRNRL